jgi:hypothetical protein
LISLLTKLLLALSLVANPVAVFASDFSSVEMTVSQAMEETKCDPAEIQDAHSQQAQHDSENCEMPCCEDSACSMQGICLVQHSSFFIIQTPLRFSHPIEYRGRDAMIAVVPERKLPPENPPPIHM